MSKDLVDRYIEILSNLSESRLAELSECYSEDIHFEDPFNDISGRAGVMSVFEKMLKDLNSHTFVVSSVALSENKVFLAFDFTYSSNKQWLIPGEHSFQGVSEVTLNSEGLVSEHIDYWDAASGVFRHIRGVRWIFRLI